MKSKSYWTQSISILQKGCEKEVSVIGTRSGKNLLKENLFRESSSEIQKNNAAAKELQLYTFLDRVEAPKLCYTQKKLCEKKITESDLSSSIKNMVNNKSPVIMV